MGQEPELSGSGRQANWRSCLRASEVAGDGGQFSRLLPGQSVKLRRRVTVPEGRGALDGSLKVMSSRGLVSHRRLESCGV